MRDPVHERDADRDRAPDPTAWLTPARLEVLASVIEVFPPGAMERGRRYAGTRVQAVSYGDLDVRARVRGRHLYDVRWSWSDDGWTSACTCPVAPDCKHAYALACVILAERLPADLLAESWMGELLPESLLRRRRDAADRPTRARGRTRAEWIKRSLREANAARAADVRVPADRSDAADGPELPDAIDTARIPAASQQPAAARRPTAREMRVLQRLRTGFPWEVRALALTELLHDEPHLADAAFEPPFGDILDLDDADLRCFLLAREIAARTDGRTPPVLAPFLRRADIEERFRADMQAVLAEQLEAWAEMLRPGSRRSLRLELGLAGSLPTRASVRMRVRVTSSRIHDEPRTGPQLRQLLIEAERDPGVLPPTQLDLLCVLFEPVFEPCLSGYGDLFELSGSALLRLLVAVAGTPLATWGPDLPARLARAGGIEPGAPLRLADGVVETALALASEADGPRLVLEQRLPDGRVLGPDERLVLRSRVLGAGAREPALILTRGTFWPVRGELPAPLPELFAFAGGLELTSPRTRAVLEPLAREHPGLQAALDARRRVHAVQLNVCLDLRDDDWLQLRSFASAAPDWRPSEPLLPDAPVFEWTPDGSWLPLDGEQRDGEQGLLRPGAVDVAPSSSAAPRLLDAAAPGAEIREGGTPDQDDAGPCPDRPAPDPGQAASPAGPAATEVWFEVPDPEVVAPVDGWLQALGAESGMRVRPGGQRPDADDADIGGWIRLSPRTIEGFADAWEARPSGVNWFGNAAARRLLSEPESLAPKLTVAPSGEDWFTVSAEWQAEGAALTDAELARLRGAESRYVRLKSGWVRRDAAQVQDAAAGALVELGIEPGAAGQRVSVWQLAQARPGVLAALEEGAGDDTARQALAALRERVAAFKGLRRVAVPRSIKAKLRPYQRDGLDFLTYAASLGLGVTLADDMGLGKTLQALAWLARLIQEDAAGGPSLVVCPASVLHNWEREAARFAPRLRVLALTAGRGRGALLARIPEHDLVLTNYALLRRDREALAAVSWRAAILDEAQNVKNPDAAVSRAARALQARHRLALTGTPLENRALDLWSLSAFVNPGYLGPRAAFERRLDRADAPPFARALLAARLRPVMLRRLKGQVAPELPPRIEEQRDCELTPDQRKLYLAEVARGRALLSRLDAAGGIARHKLSILAVLTRMRQICCHPKLAGGAASLGSGKFTALFELIEPLLAEGHKVLVFSQFVECLTLVEAELRKRGLAHHVLTGASRRRERIVAAFEADPEPAVCLISLKAGGTGLNLTAASYVVLFDPWWNPAVEAQAIDRTHRIGQDRTVIAYRLVATGTVEERIRAMQARKAALARDVLGEDGFAKALTRADLEELFADA